MNKARWGVPDLSAYGFAHRKSLTFHFYLDTNVRMIHVSLNALARVLIEITEGLLAVRRKIKLPGLI